MGREAAEPGFLSDTVGLTFLSDSIRRVSLSEREFHFLTKDLKELYSPIRYILELILYFKLFFPYIV